MSCTPACWSVPTAFTNSRAGCRFITCFVTVFATAIAITKDLPDVEGDRQHNIDTFATRLGTTAVARVGEPVLWMSAWASMHGSFSSGSRELDGTLAHVHAPGCCRSASWLALSLP